MSDIPASLRQEVVERAIDRCEYCGLSQAGQEATFHVDHVVPRAVGGETITSNLALACVSCSLRKGARQLSPDPLFALDAPLFNPRSHVWREHFRWDRTTMVGPTPSGRATIEALQMNRPMILAIREEEILRGRHPPE